MAATATSMAWMYGDSGSASMIAAPTSVEVAPLFKPLSFEGMSIAASPTPESGFRKIGQPIHRFFFLWSQRQ